MLFFYTIVGYAVVHRNDFLNFKHIYLSFYLETFSYITVIKPEIIHFHLIEN